MLYISTNYDTIIYRATSMKRKFSKSISVTTSTQKIINSINLSCKLFLNLASEQLELRKSSSTVSFSGILNPEVHAT